MFENEPSIYIPSKKDVVSMKIKQIINKKNVNDILQKKKMILNNSINNNVDKYNIEFGKNRVKTMMKMKISECNSSLDCKKCDEKINTHNLCKSNPTKMTNILNETSINACKNNNNNENIEVKQLRIVLMNFEDDVMRPIIELDCDQMKMIENWYDVCNIPIEFEMTDQIIPCGVYHEKLQNILYHDLTYSMKNEFINSYLPLIFEMIISSDKIKKYEEMFSRNLKENEYQHEQPKQLYPFGHTSNKYYDDNLSVKNKNYLTFPLKNDCITPPCVSSDCSLNLKKTMNDKISKCNSLYGIIIPKNLFTNPNKNISKEPTTKNIFFNNNDNDDENFITIKYIFETKETTLDDALIIPYNYNYNVLKPLFGLNAFSLFDSEFSEFSFIDEDVKQSNEKDIITYSIMYNLKYNKSFVLQNPKKEEIELIKNSEKYGFINLTNIETNNGEIVELINNNFGLCSFNSIAELNLKLNAFSENIEYIYNHVNINNKYANEETKVKSFIKYNFTIDNNIENRMKSSLLYDTIISCKIINKEDIPSFKIRLGKYLQDIGLEKKRYSDGIYYYGIKSKF
jgi:hypothetical protein